MNPSALTEDELFRLRELCPEQMERDPSGRLAAITVNALTSTVGKPSTLRIVHAGSCNGLLGLAGPSKYGPLVATYCLAWMKIDGRDGPDGARLGRGEAVHLVSTPTGPGGESISGAPGGAIVSNSENEIEWPDGRFGLLIEPPGFPLGPARMDLLCRRCKQSGSMPVSEVHRGYLAKRKRILIKLDGQVRSDAGNSPTVGPKPKAIGAGRVIGAGPGMTVDELNARLASFREVEGS